LDQHGVDAGYRLAPQPGPNLPPPVSKNTYLLLDAGEVRGAYMRQDQMFLIAGEVATVGNVQLPLSEGLVDRRYSSVSTFLLKHLQRENPLLFAVGMGSADQPWPRLIQAMGWSLQPVPFFFKVVRGGAFFRNIRPLRTSPLRSVALDIAAASGLGHVGMKLVHFQRSRGNPPALRAERIHTWGAWADPIWESYRESCSLVGYRDAGTLPALYPPDQRHLCYRLYADRSIVGWMVLLNTAMRDHRHFGQMRVGTILDCLTLPGYEQAAIVAAVRTLTEAGADMLLANHSHAAWQEAIRRCGFLESPSNFLLGVSKELSRRIDAGQDRIHITRGDGDGRLHL
jgi:hypothetical protein